jgi:hypothetical protein
MPSLLPMAISLVARPCARSTPKSPGQAARDAGQSFVAYATLSLSQQRSRYLPFKPQATDTRKRFVANVR